MRNSRKRIRHFVAGGGVLALAAAGLLVTSTAATAQGYDLPPDDTGTLTLHKHVLDEQSTPENPAGAPLAGVTFSVQQMGVMDGATCVAVDLTTIEGWQAVNTALDEFTPGQQTAPASLCAVGAPISATTLADGAITVPDLQGLFFVTEVSPGDHMVVTPEDPFLVTVPMPVPGEPGTWDFSVNAYPKNVLGDFTPDKTVSDENVDGALVAGTEVPWNIETPIPVAAFPYTTLTVTDSPGIGHTFAAWGDIELNGTLLAGPAEPTPDYTVSGSTVTFTAAGLAKVNALVTGTAAAPATLSLNLTTTITGDVLGSLENNAEVTLNGQTRPTPTPTSNWGELVILKHLVGDTTSTLAGARFAVYEQTAAGCAVDVTGTPVWETPATPDPSAAEQRVTLWISNTNPGEAVGTKDYCVLETEAPTGYLLDPAPRSVTISADNEWVTTLEFPNTPVEGPELPLTGAAGTLAFAFIGLGMIGTAGIVYGLRRAQLRKQ